MNFSGVAWATRPILLRRAPFVASLSLLLSLTLVDLGCAQQPPATKPQTLKAAKSKPAGATATPSKPAAPNSKPKALKYPDLDDAFLLFRRGNIDGAHQLLSAAAQKHKELSPADVMLARFYLTQQQKEQAKALLERAVATTPEDPEAYLLLAEFALSKNDLAGADGMFERGLQKSSQLPAGHPRSSKFVPMALSGLAQVDEQRQLWPQAEKHLLEWIKIDSSNPAPLGRLARALFWQKKYPEARETFAKLVTLNEKEPLPEVQMGLLYELAGQRDAASKEMTAALAKKPNDWATRLAVANWALYAGELEMAEANIQAATTLDPNNVVVKLMRGILYRFRDKPAEAEALFRAVHSESPTNFDATDQLALSLIAQNDETKRRQALEYAQLNASTHRDLRSNLGRTAAATLAWVLFRTGNQGAARQAIEPILKAGRFPPQAGYYAAEIYHAAGANDLAKKLVTAAIKSPRAFPDQASARALLAKLNGSAASPPGEPKPEK